MHLHSELVRLVLSRLQNVQAEAPSPEQVAHEEWQGEHRPLTEK
jgi:hypothetical protein